jgi:diaminopimelate decarboxylase
VSLSIEVGSTVAGHDPEVLLGTHGSPLFVYDLEVVHRRVEHLRAALPEKVELAFAVKANPCPPVLETLAAEGLGADVASRGELAAVLRAGFDPSSICFTGPGKTDREIEAALRARVRAVTIESLDELDAVLARTTMAHPGQGLLLRLTTDGDVEDRAIIGAAGSAKFGLTDAEADEALASLHRSGTLRPAGPFRLLGFHAFGASNVGDASVLVRALSDLAARAEALASAHEVDVRLLDGGGGLGIPYREGGQELDVRALGEGIAAEMATWAGRRSLRGARVLLEPGRWLVGPAGTYLARIVRTKVRDARTIAITDGGIHHLARPALVGEQQRVVAVGAAAGRRPLGNTDIVGPLCTGLDVLATSVELPALGHGDVVAVLDAGAYGFTESMPFFLSHPIPAELAVHDAGVSVARERVEPA